MEALRNASGGAGRGKERKDNRTTGGGRHGGRRVTQWNREVFEWPIKRMVAAQEHYRTLVPFAIDSGRKEGTHQVFFK